MPCRRGRWRPSLVVMDTSQRPLRRSEGFGRQLLAAALLAAATWWLAGPTGSWLGWSGQAWLAAGIVVPVAHQVLAGVGWRAELFDRWFTRRFGRHGLRVFGAGFFTLFVLRPVVVLGVAASSPGTLWDPSAASLVAAAVLAAPAVWTFLSVALYFGIPRALGVDHFQPGYDEPLVQRGAFAVVPNAMYVFGFLALWAIAVALGSRAGLAAAAFQHAMIWAHYRWIEQPDMDVIYAGRPIAASGTGGAER